MSALISVQELTARIHVLPDRPPFMTIHEIAALYETEPKRITERVKRNPTRFPDACCFRMSWEAIERWSQIASTSGEVVAKRGNLSPGHRTDIEPLVFTELGAWALAGVMKSEVADLMSVQIGLAFLAVRDREARRLKLQLLECAGDVIARNPKLPLLRMCLSQGLGFVATRQRLKMPAHRAVSLCHRAVSIGYTDRVPDGTPDLLAFVDAKPLPAAPTQLSLFGE